MKEPGTERERERDWKKGRAIKNNKENNTARDIRHRNTRFLTLLSFTNAPNCAYVLARTRRCQAEQHISLIEYRSSVITTTIGAIVGH